MKNNNMKALQQALNNTTQTPRQVPKKKGPDAPTISVPGSNNGAATASYMAPSREGKTNITAYLSPAYKASLRLIQARTGKSLQDLIAESLNDLFSKYDVPTVRND
jgi:hypothetical protein